MTNVNDDGNVSGYDMLYYSSEFNLYKRKLEAKKEALLILAKELDMVRQEKEAYQLMAEQIRDKYQQQRKKYEDRERSLGLSLNESDPMSERRNHSLIQVLCEARQQNKKAVAEIVELHQKLAEAHGDVRLLRENIARQRVGDDDLGARHFPAHEREELVKQIEEAKEQLETLQRDMVAKIDEQEEVVTERDFFRDKGDRLNQELNYVLGGDERRIVDIDALSMENRYLKERLKQCQEEKATAQNAVAKYKSALEKRRGRGSMKLGATTSGGLVISQKQVEKLLAEGKTGTIPHTQSSFSDLRTLASTLLETVHDKNMALNHQRNTNKILGTRVAELEKKLKTLEIAGLWTLPPGTTDSNNTACCTGLGAGGRSTYATLEKQRMQAGITSLIPHQVSTESSEGAMGNISGLSSLANSTQSSPTHAQCDNSLISLDTTGETLDDSWSPKPSPDKVVEFEFESPIDVAAVGVGSTNEKPATLESSNEKAVTLESSNEKAVIFESPNKELGDTSDILGDGEEQKHLSSSPLEYSPEHPVVKSSIKTESSSSAHCMEGAGDDETEQSSRLLSFESSAVDTHKGEHFDVEGATASPDDDGTLRHDDKDDDDREPSNLDKLSAILNEVQQDTDVYCVDFQVELEDSVESGDAEETPFLASPPTTATDPHAVMEDNDVAHFEGFFEGVADRMATMNLEKSMGVSPPSVEVAQEATAMVEGEDPATGGHNIASAAMPLIPKEKTQQKQLTVSGEEEDSMPQCV